MKKLFFAAACALAFTGCAEMPQQGQAQQQASEKRFVEEDDFVTGSRIARKAPKNPAPAAAPAGGGSGTSAVSGNR